MKYYYSKVRRFLVSLICMLLIINQLSILTPAAEYGESEEPAVSESSFEETENEALESSFEETETEAFESSIEETQEQYIETETEQISTERETQEAAEAEIVSSDAGISVKTEEESAEAESIPETEEEKRTARYLRGPPAGSKTVLAFTSDIHNGSDNTAANRQDAWLSHVMEEYGHIDVLSFCGDMGDAKANEGQFWSYTQSVESVVNSWDIPYVFTTGNHEFQNGKYSSTSNAVKSEYIVGDEAVYGDNFRIYCLGTENWNNNTDNYTAGQVTDLRNYLSSVGNDRPIFVLTHFPLHFCRVQGGWYGSSGRKTANADLVIDALNDAADSGQTIILLWGHNHTVSDTLYDEIYTPGSTIEYKEGSSKEFRFYYGAAGCMSDSEYGTGSAFVKGKGLVVTISGDNALSFAYYDKNGNNISGGSGGDDPAPESGVIPEDGGKYVILASDGYALTSEGTEVSYSNSSGNGGYYNYFGLSGEEYTVGEDVAPDRLLWTFTASEDGSGFYIQSQDGKYLNGTYEANDTGGYDGRLKLDDTPDVWILSGAASGNSVNARILKSTNASQSNKGDKYLSHGNGSDSSVNIFSLRSESSAMSVLFYKYEADGTFIDPNEPVEEHIWDEGVVTREPTCTAAGEKVFTCTICGETKTEAISALGHDWDENVYTWASDYSTVTASHICKRDPSHVASETVSTTSKQTPATCDTPGSVTYKAVFRNIAFKQQTKTVEIAALGHNLQHHDAKAATCDVKGNIEYWTCSRCGKFFKDAEGKNEITQAQTVIPATGHSWGDVTYTWTSDNSKVTAKRSCKNDSSHTETETINTTKTEISATCTEAGTITYSASFRNAAFQKQTKTVEVAALGHDLKHHEAKAAGCETEGNTEYWSCSRCGKLFGDAGGKNEITQAQTVIPATGHSWGEASYSWSADNNRVTANRTCENDPKHVETETVNTSKQETPATCTETGSITYSASFKNTAFEKQTKTVTTPATGHSWSEVTYTWTSDNSKVTAKRTCKNDPSHIETETVNTTKTETPATCTEAGFITYSASFKNAAFEQQTKTVATPATGHRWGEAAYTWTSDNSKVTAKRTCENDPSHVETETVNTTKTEIAATCTEAGSITYSASFRNAAFEKQTKTVAIPATGHSWDQASYSWSADNSKVTAKRTCENDPSHVETETVNTTNTEIAATCTEAGSITYSASFENIAFEEQTKTVATPALGHAYGEPEWTWDGLEAATATFTCANDATHTETLDAEITTAQGTGEDEGYTVYTASVALDGKTYTDAKKEVNKYTLTFKDGDEELAVITQDYGTEITAPADPEKEGFVFQGWDPELPATMPAQDMTFTAKWTVMSYELDKTSIEKLAVDSSEQLTLVGADGSTDKGIWTSSDESIATVDQNGLVTAVRYGKAVIHVAMEDGYEADCIVQTRFRDVAGSSTSGAPDYQYFFNAVYWAADHTPKAITKGYDLKYFGVGEACQRQDFILFIYRLAGEPAVSASEINNITNTFSDVSGLSNTFKKAIAWGSRQGIIKGYTSGVNKGKFGNGFEITRKEAMIMLWRYNGKPAPSAKGLNAVKTFTDVEGKVAATTDTYKSIAWAAGKGITNGYTVQDAALTEHGYTVPCFGLDLPCMREQMIVFLHRSATK